MESIEENPCRPRAMILPLQADLDGDTLGGYSFLEKMKTPPSPFSLYIKALGFNRQRVRRTYNNLSHHRKVAMQKAARLCGYSTVHEMMKNLMDGDGSLNGFYKKGS